MFVRWKKTKSGGRNGDLLYAVMVKSVRIDGKSRQVNISYLASIREKQLHLPHLRALFWAKAQEKMEKLDLDAETREKVELKLKSVVPMPTETELAEIRERSLRLRSQLAKAIR